MPGGAQYEAAVLAADLASDHDVDFVHHMTGDMAGELRGRFDLELSGVAFRYVPPPPSWGEYVALAGQPTGALKSWLRELSCRYDVFVVFGHAAPPWSYARASALRILFPMFDRATSWPWCARAASAGGRIRGAIRNFIYDVLWRRRLSGYGVMAANSEYSRAWTKRRWGVDSSVVYPPVDRTFVPRPKERIILSVGRLCSMKRQLDLVRAFTELTDLQAAGWRFCVAGGVADASGASYLAELERAALNLPIEVTANPSVETLRDRFERACIFWHAPGLGEDVESRPELAEHFGIATVESMRAGCIPVVINLGGQREIVRSGVEGYLWDTILQLQQLTRDVATNPAQWRVLAENGRNRAASFSRVAYVSQFRNLLDGMLA